MKRNYHDKYPYGKPVIRTMHVFKYRFLAIDEAKKKSIYLSHVTIKDIKKEDKQIEYLSSIYPTLKVHKIISVKRFDEKRKMQAKYFYDNSRVIKTKILN